MESKPDGALNDLIATVREQKLVDSIRKQGRSVVFSAGGERFTLSQKWAREFLDALLRISSVYPSAEPSDPGDHKDTGDT